MFGSLTKILDKNFVIGFFLPVLTIVFLAAWTFDSAKVFAPLRDLHASEKKIADLTYILLVVWLIAIFLMMTNYFQYRFLEGYLPSRTWFGALTKRQRSRFQKSQKKYDALMHEWATATKTKKAFPALKQAEAAKLRLYLLSNFPSSEQEILPTAFGNSIRAFEVYPREVYGADAVPVWLRLGSVIPKDFTAQIDEARTRVDCLVNLTFLLTILAVVAIFVAIRDRNGAQAAIGVVSLSIAALSYKCATFLVVPWGELVKSAFDCYLPSLIKQLGYEVPLRDSDRRTFWQEFNSLILYQQPMTPDKWSVAVAGKLDRQGATGEGSPPESPEQVSDEEAGD